MKKEFNLFRAGWKSPPVVIAHEPLWQIRRDSGADGTVRMKEEWK